MPLKIVRNDIVKMDTDAVVNTANAEPEVGAGCDYRIYTAAGFDALLEYRRKNIGAVSEGEVFVTPGFNLPAKAIIHAVSPLFIDGNHGEEDKLRGCYQKALKLTEEKGFKSVSFPLISTGNFGYPKEKGLRIAVDEINAFLLHSDISVYLVVYDEVSTNLGKRIYPDLESYINQNYVDEQPATEMRFCGNRRDYASMSSVLLSQESIPTSAPEPIQASAPKPPQAKAPEPPRSQVSEPKLASILAPKPAKTSKNKPGIFDKISSLSPAKGGLPISEPFENIDYDFSALDERMKHITDTFSQYLLYLIESKGMTNAEVYNRAVVDKKVFSKIKNNVDYHPQKLTAMCLCVGAKLNLDETRDLLARAGYALSPCDKTDIIFMYFIENEIYDMIELDIQLEEHGIQCIIA